jgi:hypothetical protein
MSEAFRRRYGLERGAPAPSPAPAAEQPAAPTGTGRAPKKPKGDTNEISSVTFTFRGVSLTAISGQPQANMGIAYDVLKELQEIPLFDKEETKTTTDVTLDEQTGTFTFSIVAQLKDPLKL